MCPMNFALSYGAFLTAHQSFLQFCPFWAFILLSILSLSMKLSILSLCPLCSRLSLYWAFLSIFCILLSILSPLLSILSLLPTFLLMSFVNLFCQLIFQLINWVDLTGFVHSQFFAYFYSLGKVCKIYNFESSKHSKLPLIYRKTKALFPHNNSW